LKSIRERIGTLFRLTSRERRLFFTSWALFHLVDPALRLLPVTRLLPRRLASGVPAPLLPVERIVWLVTAAGRHALRRPTCLGEALVLAWILRREGVEATVRIGVHRSAGGLKAHAWLEQDGRAVFGLPRDERYEPLRPMTPGAAS
jgi:hypothetical protein